MSKNYEAMTGQISDEGRAIANAFIAAIKVPTLGLRERAMTPPELENAFNILADEQRKQFDHLAGVLREQSDKLDWLDKRLDTIALCLNAQRRFLNTIVNVEVSGALAAVKPAPTVGPGKKRRRR